MLASVMSKLTKNEICDALKRLGELAVRDQTQIRLLAVGGAVMALRFGLRNSTRDVDVVILAPEERNLVRKLATQVAVERGWPTDWLNEAAKGFLHGRSPTEEVVSFPGLELLSPSVQQLLAMKLCAWRDELDISDARSLLGMLNGPRAAIWEQLEPYLVPGSELKARYAFDDLWEAANDQL